MLTHFILFYTMIYDISYIYLIIYLHLLYSNSILEFYSNYHNHNPYILYIILPILPFP